MEANSPIHYCSLSKIVLKRVKYPSLLKYDEEYHNFKYRVPEHFIPKVSAENNNWLAYVKNLVEKTKKTDIKNHPLYPKTKKEDSLELLKEVLKAEDSDFKSKVSNLNLKEGILEDSGDWYFDKLKIVNEAGHTDNASFIGQLGKI
jgi:hypothetical protein